MHKDLELAMQLQDLLDRQQALELELVMLQVLEAMLMQAVLVSAMLKLDHSDKLLELELV